MAVNFIPTKDASNIVIGILQTADAKIYVNTILSLAPFLSSELETGNATIIPPTVVDANSKLKIIPLNPDKCF